MTRQPDSVRGLPPATWLVSGIVIVGLLLVSGRYGFHRDELYFVVAGRNLAWGFVDQPPFTPAVARVVDLLPGSLSVVSLRVVPALASGAWVIVTALLASTFGATRRGIVIASAMAAVAGFFLGVGHLLSTTTFDVLFVAVIALLISWIVAGADPRWWLAVGATIGVGVLNKYTIVPVAVGLGIGLIATPARRVLASPWPYAGAGIALAIASPTLAWQASNGWPQRELAEAISGRDGPVDYVLIQLAIVSFFLIIPVVAGWRWLMFDDTGRTWRFLPIAFVILFFLFLITGGKGYYVAPLYLPLFAAGAIWIDSLARTRFVVMASLAGVGAVVGVFMALPILPPSQVGALNDVNGELGETYGWPELVDQVEAVYLGIPAEDRSQVVIFTSNYGEAGAIEVLGGDRLPSPVSGHNAYWGWGPPMESGPIIGVGWVESSLSGICPDLDRVATITNPAGLENDEFGLGLYVCMEPVVPLADVWDDLRHYD